MSGNRLTDFADRLDRIEEERQAALADARLVYKEAKGEGYNTKALRRVVTERRKPTDAALEADIEMYRSLLGEPGATYRSVAEKVGVPRSTLHRLVPRATNGTAVGREMVADDIGEWLPDHDAETGEIIESEGGAPNAACGSAGTAEPSRPAPAPATIPREMTEDDLGDPLLVIDKPRAQFREKVRAIAASIKPAVLTEIVPPPVDDDLAIPTFLDRRRSAA